MTLILKINLKAAKTQHDRKIRNSYSKFSSFRIFPRFSTNWSECPNYISTVPDDNDNIMSLLLLRTTSYVSDCNASKWPDYVVYPGLTQKPTSILSTVL